VKCQRQGIGEGYTHQHRFIGIADRAAHHLLGLGPGNIVIQAEFERIHRVFGIDPAGTFADVLRRGAHHMNDDRHGEVIPKFAVFTHHLADAGVRQPGVDEHSGVEGDNACPTGRIPGRIGHRVGHKCAEFFKLNEAAVGIAKANEAAVGIAKAHRPGSGHDRGIDLKRIFASARDLDRHGGEVLRANAW